MTVSMPATDNYEAMDAFGKENGITVTYAPWHPAPEFRMFTTGTLCSRNEAYPSGLVIVDSKGNPSPWKP